MLKRTGAILVLLPLFWGASAIAEPTHRQMDAHVHGHGTLNMALEGNRLQLELHVPSMDNIGFGHEARTDKQKALLDKARTTLAKGIKLFEPAKAARCRQVEGRVIHSHDEHEEEKHHEEGHHKEEHEDASAEHSEFRAKYQFDCATPAKLTSMDFPFFVQFPASKELTVTLITKNNQKVINVERAHPLLKGLTP